MDILNASEKLVAHGISKNFGTREVLQEVSFSVRDGEFLSILGMSGCGKTTLVRILIGLEKADQGTIYLDGQDITNISPAKRKMGMVFQNYALFENMTVLDNVAYALRKKKETRANADEIAMNMLEQVGLVDHKDKKPVKLSGGQQQRVAIARTLALAPEIILFDEPMSALDVDTRLSMRKEIKRLQEAFGTTILYITHDQEEAFALSNRIMVMDEGKIQQMDTPHNLIDHPANAFIEQFVIHNIQLKIDSLLPYARRA